MESSLINGDMEKAWQLFVEKGIIDTSIVKPDIARSWQRCLKQAESQGDLGPISADLVAVKQQQNRDLLEASQDVVLDLVNMFKKNLQHFSVMILDHDGIVIYRMNYGTDIVNPGHYCSETHTGTNGPALALVNGIGMEVRGYEHLRPNAHNWHTVGVPLRASSSHVAGALAVLNLDGTDIPLTMQTVSLAAFLIESRLQRKELLLSTAAAMLGGVNRAAVLADSQGTLLEVNREFVQLFQTDRDKLIGRSLNTYLIEPDEGSLISPSPQPDRSFCVTIGPDLYRSEHLPKNYQVDRRTVAQYDQGGLLFLFTIHPLEPTAGVSQSKHSDAFTALMGSSAALRTVLAEAEKAAVTAANILIEGESGTGKELLARAIHQASGRQGRFVAINCGSIPQELLNSELFGYVDGAFTGARKGGSPGKIEMAQGGTLFLDEIGEMPLAMQVALLRFLEDRTVTRVGGLEERRVDVRIIAATNRCLSAEVQQKNFREDLFYRLNVVNLKMPPLRERLSDIPLLVEAMLSKLSRESHAAAPAVTQEAMDILCSYSWPGNVRQLHNVLESSLIRAGGSAITRTELPAHMLDQPVKPTGGGSLKQAEIEIIEDALRRHNGNISQAARELGITRKTLYKKIRHAQLGDGS